jgi:hypothetical protein
MTESICGWALSKFDMVMSVMFGSGTSYRSEDDGCRLHSRLRLSVPARADRTSGVCKCVEGFLYPLGRSNF